jgi:hypothetical protein
LQSISVTAVAVSETGTAQLLAVLLIPVVVDSGDGIIEMEKEHGREPNLQLITSVMYT